MNIRAEARKGYILKFLLIGVGSLIMGLIHLKDAMLVYPSLRPMADQYEELVGPLDDNGKSALSDGEIQRRWKEIAEPNQWTLDPKTNKELDSLSAYNYFIGLIFTPLGVVCGGIGLLTIGKWVELNDGVLTNKQGAKLAIKDVVEIDKKRWEKKGLAKLTAETDGKRVSMMLDDIKFARKPVDTILMEIEKVAGEDKIINGQTEREYDAIRQAKEEERQALQAQMNAMEE